MVNRGEVRWVDVPGGRRPYLILARSGALPILNGFLGIPATTTIRGLPTEVELGTSDGMPKPCVLSLDNATHIGRSFVGERICALSPTKLREVCQALTVAVGCD